MRQISFERLRFVGFLCELFEQNCLCGRHEFDGCGGEVRISPVHFRSRGPLLVPQNNGPHAPSCRVLNYNDYDALNMPRRKLPGPQEEAARSRGFDPSGAKRSAVPEMQRARAVPHHRIGAPPRR